MVDGGNYAKLDAISDAGNTRINRIELRSEVGDVDQDLAAPCRRAHGDDRHLAAPDQDGHDLRG